MSQKSNIIPWTEKYRPDRLKDVVGQEHIISKLKMYVEKRSLPNLLFSGPPGVGKTCCAIALAKELFKDGFSQDFLELNASDERGINVVRGAIKDFARTLALTSDFKIIFLDEADALTTEAQQALRRTMEKYTGTVRFILNANYSSKLIAPIQSRTSLFKFKPLTNDNIKERILLIANNENIKIDEEAIQAINDISEGDLRSAINLLEATASTVEDIKEKDVYEVSNAVQPKDVHNLIDACLEGDFLKARTNLEKLLFEHGLSGEDIISQIYKKVMVYPDETISPQNKIKIIDKIAEYNFRIVQGASDRIQLEALIAQLILLNLKE